MRWIAVWVAALFACAESAAPQPSPAAFDAQPIEELDASALKDAGPALDAESPADASEQDASSEDASIEDASAEDASPEDASPDASPDADTYGPYAQDGVETFTTMTVPLTNGSSSFEEHVYLPDSAVPHAVVLFAPGTQQPASSYVPYLQRLASWGIIAVARNDPGPFTSTPELVADLVYVLTVWLPAQNADATSALFGRVDFDRIGVTGHSRGGKATLLAAEGELLGVARAYFGIDMVDVTFIDDGVYSLTNVASVGIPTAFLVASVPSNCSPANANGEVLYNAAPSPSVLLTGLGAGHTDFATTCVLCSICTPGGMLDPDIVLDYSVRYVTAFFARELLGDASVGAAFEGAGVNLDIAAGLMQVQSK